MPQRPSQARKIVVDGIESHPFHPEIEDEWLLVHQATDPKRPSLTSFFPKKGTGKKLLTVYRVLTAANLLRVVLPCSRRGHAAQPLSWCAVLHLMWDTLYILILENCWKNISARYTNIFHSEARVNRLSNDGATGHAGDSLTVHTT
jgi:hypothetical protein